LHWLQTLRIPELFRGKQQDPWGTPVKHTKKQIINDLLALFIQLRLFVLSESFF